MGEVDHEVVREIVKGLAADYCVYLRLHKRIRGSQLSSQLQVHLDGLRRQILHAYNFDDVSLLFELADDLGCLTIAYKQKLLTRCELDELGLIGDI